MPSAKLLVAPCGTSSRLRADAAHIEAAQPIEQLLGSHLTSQVVLLRGLQADTASTAALTATAQGLCGVCRSANLSNLRVATQGRMRLQDAC
jgi:hypothetical protein